MKRTSKRPTPLTRLRGLRAERGFSQMELARRIGVSQSTYCQIEKGFREPTDDERAALARLLRANESDLFPAQVSA